MLMLGLVPTTSTLAQDLFECELSVQLTPIGVCGDSQGSIKVAIEGGFGPYIVEWSSFSNRIDESMTTESTNFAIEDLPVGDYSFRVTDQYSECWDIIHTRVTYNFLQAEIDIKGNPADCNGKGFMEVAIKGQTPPYSLKLSGPKTSQGWANNNNFKIYNLPSGDYQVTIGQGECIAVKEITIGVAEGLPNLQLVAEKNECGIHTGAVAVDILDGAPGYEITWEGPSSGELALLGNSAVIAGLKTGKYEFNLTDANGCKAIGFLDLHTDDLAVSAIGIHARKDRSGVIKMSIEGGIPGYTISWSGPESGSKNITSNEMVIAVADGDYTLVITDAVGCTVSTSVSVEYVGDDTSLLGTGESAKINSGHNSTVSAPMIHQNYPNPFSNQTNISFELPEEMSLTISIQDKLGRIISRDKQTFTKGFHQYTLYAKGLTAGMYFYTVESEGFMETKRMIVR